MASEKYTVKSNLELQTVKQLSESIGIIDTKIKELEEKAEKNNTLVDETLLTKLQAMKNRVTKTQIKTLKFYDKNKNKHPAIKNSYKTTISLMQMKSIVARDDNKKLNVNENNGVGSYNFVDLMKDSRGLAIGIGATVGIVSGASFAAKALGAEGLFPALGTAIKAMWGFNPAATIGVLSVAGVAGAWFIANKVIKTRQNINVHKQQINALKVDMELKSDEKYQEDINDAKSKYGTEFESKKDGLVKDLLIDKNLYEKLKFMSITDQSLSPLVRKNLISLLQIVEDKYKQHEAETDATIKEHQKKTTESILDTNAKDLNLDKVAEHRIKFKKAKEDLDALKKNNGIVSEYEAKKNNKEDLEKAITKCESAIKTLGDADKNANIQKLLAEPNVKKELDALLKDPKNFNAETLVNYVFDTVKPSTKLKPKDKKTLVGYVDLKIKKLDNKKLEAAQKKSQTELDAVEEYLKKNKDGADKAKKNSDDICKKYGGYDLAATQKLLEVETNSNQKIAYEHSVCLDKDFDKKFGELTGLKADFFKKDPTKWTAEDRQAFEVYDAVVKNQIKQIENEQTAQKGNE